MPNLIENLQRIMRMNNVFDPGAIEVPETTPPFVPPQQSTPGLDDYTGIADLINKMYQPETAAKEQFNTLMNQYPERENPSALRKIGAGLVGAFEGSEKGREMMDAPFNRQMLDWKNKIGPAQAAMAQERLGNVTEKQIATESARLMGADKKALTEQNLRIADMERKASEAEAKLQQARDVLANNANNQAAVRAFHEAELAATNARHALTIASLEKRNTENVKGRTDVANIRKTKQPTAASLKALRENAQVSLNIIDELVDKTTDELTAPTKMAVGGTRWLQLQHFPGKTASAELKIKSLAAQQLVDLIGEMKRQSETGATGFGQMNIRELGVLEAAATRLNPAQDQEEFKKEVLRIREKLRLIMQPSDDEDKVETVSNKPTAGQLYQKYFDQ